MKIALLTLAIAAALIATSQASSRKWGDHASGDVLIYKGQLSAASSKFLRTRKRLTFPSRKSHRSYIITEVKVIDNRKSNGGRVSMKRGKIGSRRISLLFKSDVREYMDYNIEIYGNPRSVSGPVSAKPGSNAVAADVDDAPDGEETEEE